MRFIVFIILNVCLTFSIYSQQDLDPCGTPAGKSLWLKKYQANPSSFETRAGDPIYLPINVFLLADDGGGGAFSESSTLQALCRLQEDMLGTDIFMYLDTLPRTIYNSTYYNHDNILTGANMMFELNIPNTLNNYLVNEAAGNCGYNLPYAGVAVSKACAGPSDHTWVHEVGHALSIPHPFIGWEGGVSHDGSVAHDYNDPAPDTVYIDYTFFQDTLILDTMIIDTVLVEKLDGSNCDIAADGFCDTEPDYLGFRWPCNEDGFSNEMQTDPNGEKFQSDGSLFMSYAFDQCSNKFSGEQIDAMRANILTEKADYIDPSFVDPGEIQDKPFINFPKDEEQVAFSGAEFEWTAVENAEYYLIQFGFEQTISAVLFDTIVSSNQAQIFNLNEDYTYYWNVMPFNSVQFCGEFSEIQKFSTGDYVSTQAVNKEEAVYIIPNPVKAGGNATIINQTDSKIVALNCMDVSGKLHQPSFQNNRVQTTGLVPGVYVFQFILENGSHTVQKLIIK